jgi:ubiquinone/menaquinone biosynthesis C-methylase UbiE
MNSEKKEFWNARASLGVKAGTNDVNLKMLEIAEIKKFVKDGMDILEIGCGNGITAIEIAQEFNVSIKAVDYAAEMIEDAKANLKKLPAGSKAKVHFDVTDVNDIHKIAGHFDLIYCERVLINLDSWEEQKQALIKVSQLLKPGGIFCMCENSTDGLNVINSFRSKIDLDPIDAPWHNKYFNESDIAEFSALGYLSLIEVNSFTSTYYFLSRVINAWLAKQNSEEPDYGAPINKLAFQLPSIGDFGQTKIWAWKKEK